MVIHPGTNKLITDLVATSMVIHSGINRWITDYKYGDTHRD